ncbi:hypothetical protein OSB04_020417 [Centaurea solstitialis]|uniref:Uncharacterized protein n=1 Tax=Centaurea solstitialis TaxID=347529 RepID=A0AA38SS70_9ASTR|nr:hypothetical protein OSB04_020417 [Centaurea solstitialis]
MIPPPPPDNHSNHDNDMKPSPVKAAASAAYLSSPAFTIAAVGPRSAKAGGHRLTTTIRKKRKTFTSNDDSRTTPITLPLKFLRTCAFVKVKSRGVLTINTLRGFKEVDYKMMADNLPPPTHSTSNLTLLSILSKDKLTGPNYLDWIRALRIALRYEDK